MRVLLLVCLLGLSIVNSIRLFPDVSIWNQDISSAAIASTSSEIISGIGEWGSGNFQIDFSMHILYATPSTPQVPFIQAAGYFSPDCETNYATIPLPVGGAIEGATNYSCDGGDCHLLIVDTSVRKIYESWSTYYDGTSITATCLVVWDMCGAYPINTRGDQCTSADAGGFPVAQFLFTANELQAGVIDHAIRFILPNAKLSNMQYVHPGTHATSSGGPSTTAIYGNRLRLKSSFDSSSYSAAAKIVITALQTYGMFLADGGSIPLTAQSDQFTTAKWANLNFDSHSLFGITPSDFDVIAWEGTVVNNQDNCVRNPAPTDTTCPALITNSTAASSSSSGSSPSGSSSGSSPSAHSFLASLLFCFCFVVFRSATLH